MRANTVIAVALVFGSSLACDRTEPRWAGPQQPPMSAAAVYESPEAGFSFALPYAWQGGYRIEARHGADAEGLAPGARHAVTFHYVPLASAVPEQVLLRVLVFGRADWETIEKARGPQAGMEVGERGDVVYVVSVPQGNPFDEGSADRTRYGAMLLSSDQVKQAFTIKHAG